MPSANNIVESRSKVYYDNEAKFRYYADAAEGGPEYSQKINPIYRPMLGCSGDFQQRGTNRYVTQHSLEDTAAYLTRLYKSPVVNLCGPAIDLLAGTVGSPDSVIINVPNDFGMLIDDADNCGSGLNQFMLAARTQAAILGHVFIIVDSTKASGEIRTQADVIAQGVRPYFRTISPLDMLSWRLDTNGRPIEILFRIAVEQQDSILSAVGQKDQQYEYRFWSKEQWIVYKQVGEDIQQFDQGVNPLGEIPLSVLYHKKTCAFLGESLIKESSKYTQLLTNWLSDLDGIVTMQSFSQACLRSVDVPSHVGVGAAKVIHLSPDRKEGDITYGAEDFFYRSPDSSPIDSLWNAFFRMVSLANDSMALSPEATVDKGHPESGISRAWRWHSTEKRLVSMAVHEQETVRSLMYFAARWKGQDAFSGSVVYGTRFDMSSLGSDIEAMLSLQTIGLPATANTELKARVVKKALPNMDPAKQTQIDAELAAMHTAVDSRLNSDLLANVG